MVTLKRYYGYECRRIPFKSSFFGINNSLSIAFASRIKKYFSESLILSSVDVYAPQLRDIAEAMDGSARVQFYESLSGLMKCHHDSANNDGAGPQQKISWCFRVPDSLKAFLI